MSSAAITQKKLSEEQIEKFHVDVFIEEQLRHFQEATKCCLLDTSKKVVDIGGGCGYFAEALCIALGYETRVIDADQKSIETCRSLHPRVQAHLGDALAPQKVGDEGVVCFNLILHHLVGENERATRDLQKRALVAWRADADYIFVNEYAYESPKGVSGWLIYMITCSRVLSVLARLVGRFVPSLRANTLGVGVRFRSNSEWVALFSECGFDVLENLSGDSERVALARRLLLVTSIARDSFLLRARTH